MNDTTKKLLILLGVVVAAAVAYLVYSNMPEKDILTVTTADINAASAQTREFRVILSDLQTINVSSSLLDDVNFLDLTDRTQTIEARPFGRSNPFSIATQ